LNDGYFFNFQKLAYIKGRKIDGCILCHISSHPDKIVDLTVYQNRYCNVSVNLYPYNPGHLLIFPVRHIEDIRELSGEESSALHKLEKHFLNILDISHSPAGYNIGYNMGLVAGGSIRHLHLHIIPRYPNETGISDLLAGKRILVEDPHQTVENIKKTLQGYLAENVID